MVQNIPGPVWYLRSHHTSEPRPTRLITANLTQGRESGESATEQHCRARGPSRGANRSQARLANLEQAPGTGPHAMVRLIANLIGAKSSICADFLVELRGLCVGRPARSNRCKSDAMKE